MKKRLLILAVAGLALASCSNDEVVESVATSDANAISFRAFNSGMTRAADEHFGVANDQFCVTAFERDQTTTAYFKDVTFLTTDGSTYTSQSGKYYWPSAKNLDFYAFAPLPDEVGGSGSASVTRVQEGEPAVNTYNKFTVTPGTDVPNQPDFVYAVTRDWGKSALKTSPATPASHAISTTYPGVVINFSHAESKVVFKLANTNNNLKITVGDVTIGNLRGTETFTWNGVTDGSSSVAAAAASTDGRYVEGEGTLSYLNGTWTATSPQTSLYTVTMESAASYNVFSGTVAAKTLYSAVASAPNYDMILIPQALNIATTYYNSGSASIGDPFKGAYISVKIKIQNKATDDYIVGNASGPAEGDIDENGYVTAMWPLTELTWLPGHKYTYTVDLAGGGYFITNKDTNADLDPILEGAEIKFVTVTVDDWGVGPAGGVYVEGL